MKKQTKKTPPPKEAAPHKKIVKLTAKDPVPLDAKLLYAQEEYVGHYGWASNPKPHYQTVFYYEIVVDK